jgi:ribonucleoside-diphosphate reductase alpha chain
MTSVVESSGLSGAMRLGMRFERHRTKDGVDPFDLFEWSSRDVVMKNWRDGTINFQQLGVEFPSSWSDTSVSIVTSKYFRGAVGSPEREWSLRQLVGRVVNAYVSEGLAAGYFASELDAQVFKDELTYALVAQQFSFNSPVWFNVGTSSPWQVSACYILAVSDSIDDILNWYKEEGLIFKGGSGAGVNLSAIRSKKELLSSGGTASGPVSFMRGADASAGTIKSGGATRRAAKMVILDVDHPDILEFVHTKSKEERKIRALRDAGFDMELGGEDIMSVQFQNANNSVRVNDAFMEQVVADGSFDLTARKDGSVLETVGARALMREITTAAWECADPGIQYDGAIQAAHTLPNEGRISATNPCSEFVHLDNTSCNLGSIRLTKFFSPESGQFDVAGFEYLVRLATTAMEISITFGHFPTEALRRGTKGSRPIGLGYADLGAMLMSAGVGYDTVEGQALAAAVTSLMTGGAYRTSAELALAMGPFEFYENNKAEMGAVIRDHLAASARSESAARGIAWGNLQEVFASATSAWADAVSAGEDHGFRNSQASVLAPTGTIGFMMGCDTTGIEPAFSLTMFKKLSTGGSVAIATQSVPAGLRQLGYSPAEVEAICEYVAENGSILGAPGFDPAHARVFATAMGDNFIEPMGHVRMMAAVQPFLSGAISKTVNMPESATVEEVEEVYIEGWRLGLKALAIYRDNCKVGQPLSVVSTTDVPAAAEVQAPSALEPQGRPAPVRTRLPRRRRSMTTSFAVGGAEGYMTAGEYDDGSLGEVFLKLGKQGSTLAGVMDAFSMSISLGLQYGVPLEAFVAKFANMKFEPSGMTSGDQDIRMASSLVDYIFRRLALDYVPFETREALGIMSTAERVEALEAPYGVPASPVHDELDLEPVAAVPADDAHAESLAVLRQSIADSAPLCMDCGAKMRRSGSCYACECGRTTGCS